jgi:4-hydroxy-tetrahydrodipicolinate reductase
MKTTDRVRLCIIGADGRMGRTLISEASSDIFEISGAVEANENPKIGKTLFELGLKSSSVRLQTASSLSDVLKNTDVCISFTTPSAELANISVVVESAKPIVIGTTGFTQIQKEKLENAIIGRIPAVISSNFSIGANTLFALSTFMKQLPEVFDISILEAHHSGKADAPSGTALRLGELISRARGYTQNVYGRSGMSKRRREELEITSLRGGGVPGDHIVFAFGPYEMLKLEHLVFSRTAFTQGALLAAKWLLHNGEKKIYSMTDVLGFTL